MIESHFLPCSCSGSVLHIAVLCAAEGWGGAAVNLGEDPELELKGMFKPEGYDDKICISFSLRDYTP